MPAKKPEKKPNKKPATGSVRARTKSRRETEVVEKKGGCDGVPANFAKTNGVSQTWKWIQNVGTCPVTLTCYDSRGNPMPRTAEEIPPGDTVVSYSAPESAHTVKIVCPKNEKEGSTCQIELDA